MKSETVKEFQDFLLDYHPAFLDQRMQDEINMAMMFCMDQWEIHHVELLVTVYASDGRLYVMIGENAVEVIDFPHNGESARLVAWVDCHAVVQHAKEAREAGVEWSLPDEDEEGPLEFSLD